MLKNMLFAAMCMFCVAVACLIVVVGGCDAGKKAEPRIDATLGDGATAVGRLDETALVKATVYRADGVEEGGLNVGLSAGTWLVPSAVFVAPKKEASDE